MNFFVGGFKHVRNQRLCSSFTKNNESSPGRRFVFHTLTAFSEVQIHLLTASFVVLAGGGGGGRGGQRGGMGRGRGRGGRDMTLISKTVRISQGPYKGKYGIYFTVC